MSKVIHAKVNGDLDKKLQQAQEEARKYGATFQGDATKGTFTGMGVSGHYEVNGDSVAIIVAVTIVQKPWYVPWMFIESKVKGFFEG